MCSHQWHSERERRHHPDRCHRRSSHRESYECHRHWGCHSHGWWPGSGEEGVHRRRCDPGCSTHGKQRLLKGRGQGFVRCKPAIAHTKRLCLTVCFVFAFCAQLGGNIVGGGNSIKDVPLLDSTAAITLSAAAGGITLTPSGSNVVTVGGGGEVLSTAALTLRAAAGNAVVSCLVGFCNVQQCVD